jgi:hypothetical protein
MEEEMTALTAHADLHHEGKGGLEPRKTRGCRGPMSEATLGTSSNEPWRIAQINKQAKGTFNPVATLVPRRFQLVIAPVDDL